MKHLAVIVAIILGGLAIGAVGVVVLWLIGMMVLSALSVW